MNRPTLIIDLHAEELLKEYLGLPGGVDKWNALMDELWRIGLVGRVCVWADEPDEPDEPLVVVGLLMEDADLGGLVMPKVNLSAVYMERCRFDSCDLRGAELAICPGCSFRGSDLRAASFTPLCDLTSTDFTDSIMDPTTIIERGLYDEGHPPIGLPGWLLERCRPVPPEVRKPLVRTKIVPLKVDANLFILPVSQ